MPLLIVIFVVLIVCCYIKRKMKEDPFTRSGDSIDFENSGSQFSDAGIDGLNVMRSDGKGVIRDVGDIGL